MDKTWRSKLVSAEKAASLIESGDIVWLSPVCSAPAELMHAICKRATDLTDVHVWSALLMQPYPFLHPQTKGHIDYHTIFLGPVERAYHKKAGTVHALSASFSRAPAIFEEKIHPNVLLVEVSPPNDHGQMSYGPSGVAVSELVRRTATKIIAQVNPNVPFVHGEQNVIHVDECTAICESNAPLLEIPTDEVTDVERAIAQYITPMIANGSTIQLGIGTVSTAIGYELQGKRDLGIHTEMLSDPMLELMTRGAVTNQRKTYHPGKTVFGFALGSRRLYQFLDNNADFFAQPIYRASDPLEIAKNDNFVSINSALLVDLNGQVASESIGLSRVSGTGGQLDFVRGAGLSQDGKSFIAVESTSKTKEGIQSRITLSLPPGTTVTTPHSDVQYVVTEYGVADLFGKSIEQRAQSLITIAHPDFREELLKSAKAAGLL